MWGKEKDGQDLKVKFQLNFREQLPFCWLPNKGFICQYPIKNAPLEESQHSPIGQIHRNMCELVDVDYQLGKDKLL